MAFLHVTIGNATIDHGVADGRQVGERLLRRVHRRLRDNLHERRAGAVIVDQRISGVVVQFPHVFLEVNARERDFFVLTHHVAGRAGEFDFDRTAETDRLIVLRDLIIFRRVGIEILFTVPFADGRDVAAEKQTRFDDRIEGRFIHHRQRAGERKHDRIGQRIGLVTKARADARENFGMSFNLNVNLQTDDGFVVHHSEGN